MSESRPRKRLFVVLLSVAIAGVVLCFGLLIVAGVTLKSYYIPSTAMSPTLVRNDHLMANTATYDFREPKRGEVVVFLAPKQAAPDGVEREFIKRVIAVPGDVVCIAAGYVQAGSERFDHSMLRLALSDRVKDGQQGFVTFTPRCVLVDGEVVSSKDLESALGLKSGASIKIVPGAVILNGRVLDEPYVAEDPDMDYPVLADDQFRTRREWLTQEDGKSAVRIPPGRLLVVGDNRNNSNDSRFWGLLERERVTGRAWFIFRPSSRCGLIK